MFESAKEVNSSWVQADPVSFEFVVNDTINAYNIIFDVDHENTFKFQNLYAKFVTSFPDNEQSESITSLDFKTLSGESLGECSGNNCKVSFIIQSNTYFKLLGNHTLDIYQNSRLDTISGINKLSLSIQKAE
jgi:gliding motility-associated lipoprotein GldH